MDLLLFVVKAGSVIDDAKLDSHNKVFTRTQFLFSTILFLLREVLVCILIIITSEIFSLIVHLLPLLSNLLLSKVPFEV